MWSAQWLLIKEYMKLYEKSNNPNWKARLQPLNPIDARAIDIKYHWACYIKFVHRGNEEEAKLKMPAENPKRVAANIEFLSLIEYLLDKGEIHRFH